jgi:hypothetical protein
MLKKEKKGDNSTFIASGEEYRFVNGRKAASVAKALCSILHESREPRAFDLGKQRKLALLGCGILKASFVSMATPKRRKNAWAPWSPFY